MRRLIVASAGLLGGLLAASAALAGHGAAGPIPGLPAPYVKELLDDGERVLFVDLRPAEEFKRERLPGARSIPLRELLRRYAEIPRTGRVIFYCNCPPEEVRAAYQFLVDQGYRNVSFMEEPFAGWAKRGFPVER